MLRKLMQWFSKVLSLCYKRKKSGDELNPKQQGSWKHMLPKDRPFDVFDVTDNGSSPIQQLFKIAPEITIPGNFYSAKGFTSLNAKKLTVAGDCYIGGYDSASFACPNLSLFAGGNLYYGGGIGQSLALDGLFAFGNVTIPNGKIKNLNVAGSLFCMPNHQYMNNGKALTQTKNDFTSTSYNSHDGVIVDNDVYVGKDMKVLSVFFCNGNITVCGHLLSQGNTKSKQKIAVRGNIGCSDIYAESIVVEGDLTFFSSCCYVKKELSVGRNLRAMSPYASPFHVFDEDGTITICKDVHVYIPNHYSCDAAHKKRRLNGWYQCKIPTVYGMVYLHQHSHYRD